MHKHVKCEPQPNGRTLSASTGSLLKSFIDQDQYEEVRSEIERRRAYMASASSRSTVTIESVRHEDKPIRSRSASKLQSGCRKKTKRASSLRAANPPRGVEALICESSASSASSEMPFSSSSPSSSTSSTERFATRKQSKKGIGVIQPMPNLTRAEQERKKDKLLEKVRQFSILYGLDIFFAVRRLPTDFARMPAEAVCDASGNPCEPSSNYPVRLLNKRSENHDDDDDDNSNVVHVYTSTHPGAWGDWIATKMRDVCPPSFPRRENHGWEDVRYHTVDWFQRAVDSRPKKGRPVGPNRYNKHTRWPEVMVRRDGINHIRPVDLTHVQSPFSAHPRDIETGAMTMEDVHEQYRYRYSNVAEDASDEDYTGDESPDRARGEGFDNDVENDEFYDDRKYGGRDNNNEIDEDKSDEDVAAIYDGDDDDEHDDDDDDDDDDDYEDEGKHTRNHGETPIKKEKL